EQSSCIYLDTNGVTIKACDDANVGDTGVINGVTYTVVDEDMLRVMVANEEDVTKVVTTLITDMSEMLRGDVPSGWEFNQDISSWDVSNVTDMSGMFALAITFNQDISSWDVSNVIDMSVMFNSALNFDQPIGDWDVSNVNDMYGMFNAANSFNKPIGNWDVSNVTNMGTMIRSAYDFNQSLNNWDVSNVTDMNGMFEDASSFNQDIGDWNVNGVNYCFNFNLNTPQWTLPKPNFTNCNT
ncbi:BspA family leucine-rich repeat surface protein, partial [Flavobacteriaceae bacterium]|nr:BspA family leucine-rich repeat surface protein [Flavobacteriaceae bacterium]